MNRLTEEVQRLEEDVALYGAQRAAQEQETKAVKEALSEAVMELEVGTYVRMYVQYVSVCTHFTYVVRSLHMCKSPETAMTFTYTVPHF